MNYQELIVHSLNFVLYVVLQILFLHHVMLFNVGFCYIYIAFLLLLPFEISTILLMLIGFFVGLIIDLSYNMLGVHMFSCVLLGCIRNRWIGFITSMGGYENFTHPSLSVMGLNWFTRYVFWLTLFHHIPLFLLESFSSQLYLTALFKAGVSTMITCIFILIIQYVKQIFSGKKPSAY